MCECTVNTFSDHEECQQDKTNAVLDDDVGSGDLKRMRCATYGNVEAALYKLFVDARAKNILLNGTNMLVKARDLGFALGHNDFKPGNEWLQQFKKTHGRMCKNVIGEPASMDNEWLQQGIYKKP